MSFNIMGPYIIRSIEHRLQKRLPIKTKEEERYFRDRFYWVVDKFKEQYFVGGESLDTNAVLDEMFSYIKSSVGDLDLNKLEDFKIALACSLFATADTFGCSVKVTTDFFQDQFLRVVDQRFLRQTYSVKEHARFLCVILKYRFGIEEDEALKIIDAGIFLAESCPDYNFSLSDFQFKIIDGIVEEGKRINIPITRESLVL